MIINIINLSTDQPATSVHPSNKKEYIRHSREERVLNVCKQSKEQGFAVRFWEGIIEPNGVGINKAFKKIVRWAKEQGLKMVCIGEDDLIFSAPGAWQYYLDNLPDDFDIYSGGIYSGEIKDGRIMNGFSGNTLITVHQRFYDFFLNINPNDHIDRACGNFCFEKMYRIVDPFVVFQMQGYSDNHRRMTQHTAYLENMKLFGRD